MTTNSECTNNRNAIYKRIANTERDLAQIKGGVNVLKWLLPIMFSFVCALLGMMAKQRFDELERQIERLTISREPMETVAATDGSTKEMTP